MSTYKFKRTMQYTEEVEVEADSLEAARELADEADGVRNNDDTVIDIVPMR